jgi:two-component system, cell cycle sensor histidine kinase and response regulator CckA
MTGPVTILVVDDEEVVRQFSKIALTKRGYRVLLAGNGKEGVDLFRQFHNEVSLIVLDLMMPKMSGEEALEHFRQITPSVPVIVSSGFSQAQAAERFVGKNISYVLTKPYTSAQLTRAIEDTLAIKTAGAGQA